MDNEKIVHKHHGVLFSYKEKCIIETDGTRKKQYLVK